MKRILLIGGGILLLILSIILYVSTSREPEVNNTTTIEQPVNSEPTSFTFKSGFEFQDKWKYTVNTIGFQNNDFSLNQINSNTASLEKDGVQLLITNPGVEAFNIYFLKSNEFVNISKNEFFANDILRYKDNGEIKEGNNTQYLKYNLNYFYVDKLSKDESQCADQYGCPGAAILPSKYNLYVYCSVQNIDLVPKCDQLLLDLKFDISQREEAK